MPFLSWLVSFLMAFSGQAVITFAAAHMLKSTRPGVLWVVAIIGCIVTAYVNAFDVPADMRSLWSAINLLVSTATYIAFSELRALKALFMVACIMLVTLLAELVVVLAMLFGFGVNVTAGPSFAFEHPGIYLALIILHALVLGIFLYIVFALTRRITMGKREGSLAAALVFPISQSALLLAAMLVVRVLASQDELTLIYGALLCLVVLGSYLLFYFAARWISAQEVLEACAAAAQEQSSLVYSQAQDMAAQSQRIAKVRHDFRNQVSVIELLYKQGETAQAREMTTELLRKVDQERTR